MSAAEEKQILRRRIREKFPGDAIRIEESREICKNLMRWPVFLEAGTVAMFMPLKWEADIAPLVHAALSGGKRVLLPLVQGRNMSFRLIGSVDELAPGAAFGILEPPVHAPRIDPAEADLMLVPLDAADRDGWRLGKGGGYYDRALLESRPRVTCGAVLSHQWVPHVPRDMWDCCLDWLCDAHGLCRCPAEI